MYAFGSGFPTITQNELRDIKQFFVKGWPHCSTDISLVFNKQILKAKDSCQPYWRHRASQKAPLKHNHDQI